MEQLEEMFLILTSPFLFLIAVALFSFLMWFLFNIIDFFFTIFTSQPSNEYVRKEPVVVPVLEPLKMNPKEMTAPFKVVINDTEQKTS